MSNYERKVRAYTPEEAAEIERGEEESVEQKMARRTRTHEIDVARYMEAAQEHPELFGHMARMIIVSANSLEGWKRIYATEVDSEPSLVNYRGTEGVADRRNVVTVPTGFHADIPA